jgi:hypothetical protein
LGWTGSGGISTDFLGSLDTLVNWGNVSVVTDFYVDSRISLDLEEHSGLSQSTQFLIPSPGSFSSPFIVLSFFSGIISSPKRKLKLEIRN